MNIAFVSDQYWPSLSGVSVSIDAFSEGLAKMGHNVYLFVPEYPNSLEFENKYATVYHFRSYQLFFNKESRLVFKTEKKKIFQLFDSIKPDIIHIQTEFIMGKLTTRYAKRKKIPLVMTAHTNWEELISLYVPFMPYGFARIFCRFWMKHRYNKADMAIVPSSLMELMLNLYFVKSNIRVIPTGIIKTDFEIDFNSNWKDEVFNIYPQLKNKKILFFAGRLGMEKNIPFLVDALKLLIEQDPNIFLLIAGYGPVEEELQKYAIKLGVENNVIFAGFIDRQKLKYFYAISNVFVFASKVESQGLVILESMVCGTPVVAIGKMGTREVMGGDNGGFMVDDDLDEFVEKITLLLNNDSEIYKTKSKEAIIHAGKWTNDIQTIKLLKLYKTVIKNKKGINNHECCV